MSEPVAPCRYKLARSARNEPGKARSPSERVRRWYVTPPELMPWLSSEDRDQSIVLFDFDPDVLETGELRFDLQVAFKCIAVHRQGWLDQADFYIASTSASVQIDFEAAQINACTPCMELTVNYTDTKKRTRVSHPAMEPSAEFKSAALEFKVAAGAVSFESGRESIFQSSFAYAEGYLGAVNLGNSVIWRLDPPRRIPVVRDFLFGNLHLYAVCTDNPGASRGQMTVRPSDVRFFGPDRRPYPKAKSFWLLYSLFKARRSIFRPRGIAVKFSEKIP